MKSRIAIHIPKIWVVLGINCHSTSLSFLLNWMIISLNQLLTILFVAIHFYCWTSLAVSDTEHKNELLDCKFTAVSFQKITKTLSTTTRPYKYVNVSTIVNSTNILNELVDLFVVYSNIACNGTKCESETM